MSESANKSFLTSPQEAYRFVKATGVSALAVSVGNIHLLTNKEYSIDLNLLEDISKTVDVPLVMHGGSGFPDALLEEVANRGVRKFNLGTILKKVFLEEIKDSLEKLNLSCQE